MTNRTATKKRSYIPAVFALSFIATHTAIAATCDPTNPTFCNPLNLSGNGIQSIGDAVVVAVKFLLSFTGVVCMFFIVISGVKYITSAGDQGKLTNAKNTLTSALTGLVIALVSYGIVKALEDILTVR